MSADDGKNGRKTLLPEFLPAPEAGSVERASPPERVGALARLLLRRFRGLGTTAGAAMLSLQSCGYSVVDPIPPPPMQCTVESPPFASIHAFAYYLMGSAANKSILLTVASSYPPSIFTGYSVSTVHVTGGTLVSVENVEPNGASRFVIQIDDPASEVLVDVDLSCGGSETTKHYRITADALNSTGLMVEEITAVDGGTAADAGTD